MNIKNNNASTVFGACALALWTVEPLIVSEIDGVPLFESLAIMFSCGFMLTVAKVTFQRKWGVVLSQPVVMWVVGALGLCGYNFTYMLASKCAPIAHVDLIDYLWPCFVVLFVGFLPKEKFTFNCILGTILGMAGVGFLILNKGFAEFYNEYIWGYLLAFYGSILWGVYSAFSRHYNNTPSDMIGMYFGVGALVTWLLHFNLESMVLPSVAQSNKLLFLGTVSTWLVYQLWDYGVRRGNVNLLSSVAYLARVFSMTLLIVCGKEQLTIHLVIAVFLACFGVFIINIKDNVFILLKNTLLGNVRRVFINKKLAAN